jgi:hypothetical protein
MPAYGSIEVCLVRVAGDLHQLSKGNDSLWVSIKTELKVSNGIRHFAPQRLVLGLPVMDATAGEDASRYTNGAGEKGRRRVSR